MQKGLTLVELAQKIEDNKAAKRDFIVDTRAAEMVTEGGKIGLAFDGMGDGITAYPINEVAHDQIGARLGIPSKYYDTMKAEAPELLASNVNHWLHTKPQRRMVRTLRGVVRSVNSDRYNRIENEEIAEVALPIIMGIPGVRIVSNEVTERRLHIQFSVPTITGEVKVGDRVEAGVAIGNSEVGLGSTSVSPFALRLICLNGMKIPDGKFTARHVGRQVEDSEALWADDTRRADDRVVLLKMRDAIHNALDQVSFTARINQMSGLAAQPVTGDPAKAVELLAAKVGATEGEQAGILRALITGGDLSAWGLLNAVTAQAHTGTYDRAVELEAAGGALLALPAPEWAKVLQAA